MYLSPNQVHLLGQVMQTLVEPHEEAAIRTRVGELVLQLLDLVRPAFTAALRRCRPEPRETVALSRVVFDPATARAPRLSEREREVANLAACGLADKEIARRLGIAITTVRTHIDHAFRKLEVDSRMKLANKLGR